jgi:magnesium-transporting ATPase (P-type)
MYQFYNSFFTSGAILVWAITDEEYSMEESMKLPEVYRRGQNGEYFNKWTYWKNIFLGACYGVISLFFVCLFMEQGVIGPDGRVSYKSETGMVLYANMVMIVNLKVVLMSHGISLAMLVILITNSVCINIVSYHVLPNISHLCELLYQRNL